MAFRKQLAAVESAIIIALRQECPGTRSAVISTAAKARARSAVDSISQM